MRKKFALVALMTSTMLIPLPVIAAGKATLGGIPSTPHVTTNGSLPVGTLPEGEFVPLPRSKPEIGPVALLMTDLPPIPFKRPIGIELPPHPLTTGLLSARDLKIYKEAFAAADNRQWNSALEISRRATYKLPAEVIEWRYFRAYRNHASFDQISRFIDDHPDWPGQRTLRRRAEQALDETVSRARILKWFAHYEPVTGIGMYRYGDALISIGKQADGTNWVRKAWLLGEFSKQTESEILKKYNGLLTTSDHEKRLDHLLWERETDAAVRLFPLLSEDAKKLATARIRLIRNSWNVDQAIRAVPADLQNDPGLIFERAKWRRRKALDDESRELLLEIDDTAPRADIWWPERHLHARKLLSKGHITEAYNLASQHGLTDGADFAAAEWLSGWIMLRFLNDGEQALLHFTRLYENVSYPISRSRGAYWIGRAKENLGEKVMAEYWYKVAAQYYTTYYGQMALHELGQKKLPAIPQIASARKLISNEGSKDEQILIVRHLAEIGAAKWTKPFLLAMTEKAQNESEYIAVADLATAIGRPDYAIAIAKRASQLGTELTEINWPTPSLAIQNPPIEPALMLAITRQESAFASDAVSWAGARGLMQLMPGTAKQVSRKLNVNYSKPLLTADPSYNAMLGSAYLASLIEKFNGSYVLAIASYNAGPANVSRWLKQWGDPRSGDIDMVDWIELIPFSETRNYVQRVIENLQVYRERLAEEDGSVLKISYDINRGMATH
ncbi:lytic transglycosylase domain-containing protein [Sneathiella sp. HT1-7]|uniref:lytic transglycosylase domain-containing protein n=1 Tax=Sneathiella sp. HT1-7 TaxID=2887192 RepID=UPI001D13ACC2|nr:lytic transglycosylase domain-containing protein [Sneathiella sp. HT1-7]MCC3305057.1 lytic transglycosylase domain-containing protein [Sneathiella sp. HT1-7]